MRTGSPSARIHCASCANSTSFQTGENSTGQRPALRQMGDIGYLDDGYLHLVGREGFMIISGGVNIYPEESEDVLLSHPDVIDAGVIGVPDPEFGESVKAVVSAVFDNRVVVGSVQVASRFCSNFRPSRITQ